MKFELFLPLSIHEIGNRPNQEDSLYPCPNDVTVDNRLFIVCDGMGGHEKGEVASQTVCQALSEWFSKNVISEEPFTDELLKSSIAYAYEKLDEQDDGSPKKMGTTLTFLYLHAQGVTVAHMGDSRIYHIRPSKGILYQSRDHSLVFDLFRSGEITYDEMATHPQKNVITKAMTPGEENRADVDIVRITDVKPGDYFYMCSDGMLEQMTNEELCSLLSADVTDEKKRSQLIKATEGNGDNHTAWLIHVKEVRLESGEENLDNEELTSPFNAINIIRSRQQEEAMNDSDSQNDVEIVEQGDVVIMPDTKRSHFQIPKLSTKSLRNKKVKAIIVVVVLALLAACLYYFFLPKDKKTRNVEPTQEEFFFKMEPVEREEYKEKESHNENSVIPERVEENGRE